MAVQTQIQTRRGTAASWTSTNPTLAAGEIGFETDTGKFKIGNGSTAWAALAYSAGATAVTYLFNATSGQTTFSGADANGLTLAYTVGAEQVYLNGVLQVRGSDYTATNGTSIVLTSGALTSDVLNVIAYSAMTITDTYTQAQADAKFFQNANAFVAGKNKIINGDFGIWQRGTSLAGGGFLADRWNNLVDGSGGAFTFSQQTFTPGTAPVAGYEGQYFHRYNCTSARTGQTYTLTQQLIEDVRTLAGQTVTFSFWAKADATRNIGLSIGQIFGGGGSGNVVALNTNQNFNTSWTRYSYTFSMPSISGKTIGTNSYIELRFFYPNNTACTIDLWGVQLEAGSITTAFQTATGTLAGELAACQRYYWRQTASSLYNPFGIGTCTTTTAAQILVYNPVPMRVAPTSVEYSSLVVSDIRTYNAAVTSVSFAYNGTISSEVTFNVASGGIVDRPTMVRANNSTSAYLGMSAEL